MQSDNVPESLRQAVRILAFSEVITKVGKQYRMEPAETVTACLAVLANTLRTDVDRAEIEKMLQSAAQQVLTIWEENKKLDL